MIAAVASGKGGTGKTTIAVCLAATSPGPVCLVDCDVEAPNDHLFLPGLHWADSRSVDLLVPTVNRVRCDGCGACSRFCRYNALAVVGNRLLVFPELCHGCGGCALVCPRSALEETPWRVGAIQQGVKGDLTLIEGRLDVGKAMSPPVIRAVKTLAAGHNHDAVLLDAPPGTSCPVVTTVRGADVVLLVTEPTPFGLHDLALAVEMLRELALPCGVVVNRMGAGDDRVHRYCREQNLPVLLELPQDRRIAEAYAQGRLPAEALPEYRSLFETLWTRIADLAQTGIRLS